MAIGREFRRENEGFHAEERIRRGAETAIARTIKAGAEKYERARDLPRLARIFRASLLRKARKDSA